MPLILGSASPRRAELLARLTTRFEVRTVDIDESALIRAGDDEPGAVALRIAAAKFSGLVERGFDEPARLITADTLVACEGAIMGKPRSDDHLAAMLDHMSGRTLAIATAVCVGEVGGIGTVERAMDPMAEVVTTLVELRELTSKEIDGYVATGVGADKAGGLALQSGARPFVAAVRGCWANVLGLPVCAVVRLLGPAVAGADRRGIWADPSCSVERCGRHERQHEPDFGTAVDAVAGEDGAPVTGHDLLDDGQTES